jgi:peptidoglycan/xylan/chitin deacetylase (PgdA/CDA1 family)
MRDLPGTHWKRFAAVMTTVLAVFTVSSCTQPAPQPPPPAVRPQRPPPPPTPRLPSPESVHANELGEIPILMYHRITTTPSSVYDRTPQDFRAELERLAAERYVPISATDYSTGHIDIPAGTHPVVLTFDDGSTTQFTMDSTGQPAPDTAVRILLGVAAEHPGFPAVATFYVNQSPFDDNTGTTALTWLHDHGFEIGNHTLTHPDLADLTPAQAQHEIAGMQRIITDAVPGLPVRTLALPFGSQPQPSPLAISGSSDGVTYHHDGVMLVGANPAPAPFSADFDPSAIPRIRSQGSTGEDAQYCSTAWLDWLDSHSDLRYTSDGDPQRISTPAQNTVQPAPAIATRLYRY